MSNKGFLAVLAAIGFIALLSFGLIAKGGPSLEIGDTAPDASVDRLSDDGEVSTADYQGQWVLVNFWASWCAPCADEAPAVEDFAQENSGDVVVLGVASRDATSDAEGFAREHDLTYELLHDGEGDMTDSYGVKGLPESFLIDPDGKIAYIYRGPVDAKILEDSFKPMIDGET